MNVEDIKSITDVLNIPDEIFYMSSEKKLKYFKKLNESIEGLLALREDILTQNTSPATFIRTTDKKYIQGEKKKGTKLYP